MSRKPPVEGPEKDDICPNFQKPLHKVCPTCHFYQHMRGLRAEKRYEGDPGEWMDFWGCTIAAQYAMTSGVSKAAGEQTQEMNILRNKIIEMNNQQGMLMAQVGRTIEMLMQQIAIANHQRQQALEQRGAVNGALEH